MTPANVVFVINRLFVGSDNLKRIEPEALSELMDNRMEVVYDV